MKGKIALVLITLFILSFAQQRDSIVRIGALKTIGSPRDVEVRNIYGYVADADAFVIADVSDPANPTINAYSNNTSWAWAEGVCVKDTLAFINRTGGVKFVIVNIADPDTIIKIGERTCVMSIYPLPWGVGIKDTVGFMAGGDLGLWIFNISDLTNPTLIDTFNTPGHLFDFFIKDTLLYAADRDSLLIFNITDPANVSIVGTLPVPEGVSDVFVDSIYAYLACRSTFGTDGRMKIVNVSNPTNPELLGEGLFDGNGRGIFVANGYVYVAAEDWWFSKENKGKTRADVEGGIRIFDPDPVTNPAFLCDYDTPGNPRELYVQNDLIFVADYDSLQILRHLQSSIDEETKHLVNLKQSIKIYPTPFNKVVNIGFTLPYREKIVIEVFDLQGRNVKTIYQRGLQAGRYNFYWHGTDNNGQKMPAGMYFIKITAGSNSCSKKVLFVKE